MNVRNPRWLRESLVVLAVLGVGYLVLNQLLVVSVNGYYSPGWTSQSSSEARARGILISTPVVATPQLQSDTIPVKVVDAWIEEVTRLEYRFYLIEREVREGRYRMVVLLEPRARLGPSARLARLVSDSTSGKVDTLAFRLYIGGEGVQRTYIDLKEPPPTIDRVFLTIVGDRSSS